MFGFLRRKCFVNANIFVLEEDFVEELYCFFDVGAYFRVSMSKFDCRIKRLFKIMKLLIVLDCFRVVFFHQVKLSDFLYIVRLSMVEKLLIDHNGFLKVIGDLEQTAELF